MRRTWASLLTFLLAIVPCVLADGPTTAPVYRPHYLTAGAIDVVALLPDPPQADSPEHQAEFELLFKLQRDRTPADVARATEEEHHLPVFAFADVLGPQFTAENCPKTAAFFKTTIQADLSYFNKVAKDHWNRPRPHADPRVHSLFIEKDGSYPSGHSIRATLFGELLATALPQYRQRLTARSQQMGWDREIAGVHFPTDVYAGRILGMALAHALLANPDVRAQLEALKPELEKAAGTDDK